jgi:hypothetical protein
MTNGKQEVSTIYKGGSMEIQDFSNMELMRNYGALLSEIKNNQSTKKQFEEEFIKRLRNGELSEYEERKNQ